jgi:soluble P-type ATPase
MAKRIAVVFDSAGTLLHMYRVAKEVRTGRILENIESTAIVAKKNGCGLVVLNTENETILHTREDMLLFDFIKSYRVPIGVSCSKGEFPVKNVYDIIKGTQIQMGDVQDVLQTVSYHCPNIFYLAAGLIIDSDARDVPYVLSTGGQVFATTLETLRALQGMDVDTYIASGDSMRTLSQLAEYIGMPPERIFALATTNMKEEVVLKLKNKYEKVVMVGDGINDILALRAADLGIMTVQQGDKRPEKLKEAADLVLDDIIKVVDVVKGL